jgi:hypothetical protein
MTTTRRAVCLLLCLAAALPIHAEEEVILANEQALAHPVGKLALKYATLLHEGRWAEIEKLMSREALKRRAEMPADERAESAAYIAKMVPQAAQLEADIKAGSQLIIDGKKAYLNTIKSTSRTNEDGSVTTSSEATNMPFELEDAAWKVAQ